MESKEVSEFICKFQELNEANQKYIIAIQQALTFAQLSTSSKEESKTDFSPSQKRSI